MRRSRCHRNACKGSSASACRFGTDAEDGTLSGASLVWTSSLDAQIGTGTSFTASTLSVGSHTITLTATDSEGATGTASIQITVQEPSQSKGRIAFASTRASAYEDWDVFTARPDGSDVHRLTYLDLGRRPHQQFSPDGTRIAYARPWIGSDNGMEIVAVSPADLSEITIVQRSRGVITGLAWAPDGTRLAYAFIPAAIPGSRRSLYVVNSDGSGDRRLIEGMGGGMAGGSGSISWGSHNLIAYTDEAVNLKDQIFAVNPDTGETIQLTNWPWDHHDPQFAPGSPQYLAFAGNPYGNWDICFADLTEGLAYLVTNHPADDVAPVWAPDLSAFLLQTDRDGNHELYVYRISDQGLTNVTQDPAADAEPSWSAGPGSSSVLSPVLPWLDRLPRLRLK